MFLNSRATRSLLVAGALAGGVLIAGCGGSSNGSSTGSSNGSSPRGSSHTVSLTRAAQLSTAATGFKLSMSMHETVGGKGIDLSGNGSFNQRPREGSMLVNVSVAGQTFPLQVVLARGTMYEQLPSQFTSRLPGGRPWISINLRQLGRMDGIPGLSSLTSSGSSASNPGQYLDYLKAAGGSVQNLGQETVDGVQTTHYRAPLDIAKLARVLPASARSAASQLIGAVQKRFHPSYGPIDVWIDQSSLVRKIRMTFNESVAGHSIAAVITEHISDYGRQPAPSIPPASQTTNVLSLIHAGG